MFPLAEPKAVCLSNDIEYKVRMNRLSKQLHWIYTVCVCVYHMMTLVLIILSCLLTT